MNTIIENSLDWDAIRSFEKVSNQINESYHEQQTAPKVNIKAIDDYQHVCDDQGGQSIKCAGTHGAPGSGKSFTTLYSSLYMMLNGLKVVATLMISRQSVYLGGVHIHKLFNLPLNNSISLQIMAELVVVKILSNPVRLNVLCTINILFIDEAGQVLAELLSVWRICDNSIPFGGILTLCTIDHTQLVPVFGKPFFGVITYPKLF